MFLCAVRCSLYCSNYVELWIRIHIRSHKERKNYRLAEASEELVSFIRQLALRHSKTFPRSRLPIPGEITELLRARSVKGGVKVDRCGGAHGRLAAIALPMLIALSAMTSRPTKRIIPSIPQ